MPLLFDITYWSLSVWPIGYFVSLPIGFVTYGYFDFAATYTLFQVFAGQGTWDEYFAGPFRQAFVGHIIFMLATIGALVPVLGILTSWACLVWAKANYYDYGEWPEYASTLMN